MEPGQWTADGKVAERFTEKTTGTIKGQEFARNATSENPTYLIEQAEYDRVMKSHCELRKAN